METTITSTEQELKPFENSVEKDGVVVSLENNELIKQHGGLENYLATKLLWTIESAVAPDNKGTLHIDYRTREKTMETLLKLMNKNFNSNGVHINFFSSPKTLRH